MADVIKYDVAVSYGNNDRINVDYIVTELNNMGMTILYYKFLVSDAELQREIILRIINCNEVIFFLTSDFFQCNALLFVTWHDIAVQNKKKIHYVFLDDIEHLPQLTVDVVMLSFFDEIQRIQGIKAYLENSIHDITNLIFNKISRSNRLSSVEKFYSNLSDPNDYLLSLDCKIGQIIRFGKWPQRKSGEPKPIEWVVLDIKDGNALLLSYWIIDVIKFNEKWEDVIWEISTLRKWMNVDFKSQAFDSQEKNHIVTVTNRNIIENYRYYNYESISKEFNPTYDTVFILSKEEIKQYKQILISHESKLTDYAQTKWIHIIKNTRIEDADIELYSLYQNNYCFWWLRSSSEYRLTEAYYCYRAGMSTEKCYVNEFNGVRPAIWIKV